MKKYTTYCVVSLLIFSLFGCARSKPVAIKPVEEKKDIVQEIDLSKIPEFEIDWNKYPTIDLNKEPKKPLKEVGRYPKEVEFTNERFFAREDRGLYMIENSFTDPHSIMCLDLDNKKLLWKSTEYSYVSIGGGFVGKSLIAATTKLYDEHTLCSIDIDNDKVNWKYQIPNVTIEINLEDSSEKELIFSYQYEESIYLFALDTKTGKELWEKPVILPKRADYQSYTFIDNKILLVDENNYLNAIDRASGKLFWSNRSQNFYHFYFSEILHNKKLLLYLFSPSDHSIKKSFFLLDINTGKTIEDKIQFLDLNPNITIQEYLTYQDPFIWFLISLESSWYLSQVDVTNWKEIWRIPLGRWLDLGEESSFCEIITDSNLPETIYLDWHVDPYPLEEKPRSNDQISHGFYKIDTKSGKFIWKITKEFRNFYPFNNNSSSKSIFFTQFSNVYKNERKLACLDLKTGSVLWGWNFIGAQLIEDNYQDTPPWIYRLLRITEEQKEDEDGYIEFSPDTGKIVAYYPHNWEQDRLSFCFLTKPYRFFQNPDGKLIQMELQK